ncbi:extensin [Streptomyces gobiensis]|uniref:extensin n=1 Tax=Streptomyces gobiensis TaxID=2875706 RepID=UPI001E2C5531|nr:extensin [Streptomyces gobiensis]UGY91978.1 extensin [Streptomyces gobiensis]
MGRHRRPTRAHYARATTLKAAAALSVAGSFALGFQMTAGSSDEAAQARSGADSQPDQLSGTEQTAADTPSSPGQITPTAAAEPTLLEERTGDDTRTSRAEAYRPGTKSAPDTAASAAPTRVAKPATSDPVKSSSSEETTPTKASTSTEQSSEPQSDDSEDGGQDKGLVDGLVDTVDKTVDDVAGGLSGGLLGG